MSLIFDSISPFPFLFLSCFASKSPCPPLKNICQNYRTVAFNSNHFLKSYRQISNLTTSRRRRTFINPSEDKVILDRWPYRRTAAAMILSFDPVWLFSSPFTITMSPSFSKAIMAESRLLQSQTCGSGALNTTYEEIVEIPPYVGIMFTVRARAQPIDITTLELDLRLQDDSNLSVQVYFWWELLHRLFGPRTLDQSGRHQGGAKS